MMADSPQRHATLYRLVRDFSLTTEGWRTAIRYRTLPDEEFDLTLTARRVYGSRNEWLVIQAAAGLDSPELGMSERDLVLPTTAQLAAMKAQAGYNTTGLG
jgi:hypothetical protein